MDRVLNRGIRMGHSPLQVTRAETKRNRNPQLCTTAGPEISKGRASIVQGWIQRWNSSNTSSNQRDNLTNETIKGYLTIKRTKPRFGPCTLRRCLLRCNTEQAWRRGRTGIVSVGMGLPFISPLNPRHSCHPANDNLPDELLNLVSNLPRQHLCARIRLGAVMNLNSASWVLGVSLLISSPISMVETPRLSWIGASHYTPLWLPPRQFYRTQSS